MHRTLTTPGQPLDERVLDTMGAAFGFDFSTVRVHPDGQAARSARDIAATAYTFGDHVVFKTGAYAPGTREGDRLIAHELAHVVQQRNAGPTAPAIGDPSAPEEHHADHAADAVLAGRRAPAPTMTAAAPAVRRVLDFEIRGVEDAPGDTMNVFFDRNSATIPAIETPKIAAILAAIPSGSSATLDGYASEDEPATLADDRALAVDTALGPPTRTKRNVAARGIGRIEYRQMRKVEVQVSTTGTPPPPPSAPTSITRPCGTALTACKPRAKAILTNAIGSSTHGLNHSPLSPETTALLTTLFGGATGVAQASNIRTKLIALRSHISTEIGPAGTVQCHTMLDANCVNPAYNVGTGPSAVMTLCPGFLDHPTAVEENAATLIHEAAHGTTGLATDDIAYGHTRLITALTTAQAQRNTDSYVLLARNITAAKEGTAAITIGLASDVRAGMNAAEELSARNSLAHAEKWLTQAYQDVAGLYDTVNQSIGPGAWTGTTAGFDRDNMHRLAPLFGLTDPGTTAPFTAPTNADKIMLAAIHDRFLAMRSVMWSQGVTMTKVAAPATDRWATGPGSSVELTAAFFGLSLLDQVKRLIALLTRAHMGITLAMEPHYVTAADQLRQHRGLGP